jgi:hypothetical protein
MTETRSAHRGIGCIALLTVMREIDGALPEKEIMHIWILYKRRPNDQEDRWSLGRGVAPLADTRHSTYEQTTNSNNHRCPLARKTPKPLSNRSAVARGSAPSTLFCRMVTQSSCVTQRNTFGRDTVRRSIHSKRISEAKTRQCFDTTTKAVAVFTLEACPCARFRS